MTGAGGLPRRVIPWQMRACWSLAGSASRRAAPRCSTSASASACCSVGSHARPSASLLAMSARVWAAESNFSLGLAKLRTRRPAGPLRLLAPARAAGQGADRLPGCTPGSGLVALAIPAAVPILPAAGVLHQHRPVLAGLARPRRHVRSTPAGAARASRAPEHRPAVLAGEGRNSVLTIHLHAAACPLSLCC